MFHEHTLLIKIGGIPCPGFCQAAAHVPGPTAGWQCHASASVCFDASSGNCWPSSGDCPWATLSLPCPSCKQGSRSTGELVSAGAAWSRWPTVWVCGSPAHLLPGGTERVPSFMPQEPTESDWGWDRVWNGHFPWLTSPVLLPHPSPISLGVLPE